MIVSKPMFCIGFLSLEAEISREYGGGWHQAAMVSDVTIKSRFLAY